jgi:hypothetical protein
MSFRHATYKEGFLCKIRHQDYDLVRNMDSNDRETDFPVTSMPDIGTFSKTCESSRIHTRILTFTYYICGKKTNFKNENKYTLLSCPGTN